MKLPMPISLGVTHGSRHGSPLFITVFFFLVYFVVNFDLFKINLVIKTKVKVVNFLLKRLICLCFFSRKNVLIV